MTWWDAIIDRRRKQRKRREGQWDWWDDEWRVEQARRKGIRYSDDELRSAITAALNTGRPPLWSFNEYQRAWALIDQCFDADRPEEVA